MVWTRSYEVVMCVAVGALDVALLHGVFHGLPTTTCFPYKGSTEGVKCSDKCRGETPSKVQSYCKVDGVDSIKR